MSPNQYMTRRSSRYSKNESILPARTSSPTRYPENFPTISLGSDEKYEEFKAQLGNQHAKGTVIGLNSPRNDFLSGHILLKPRKMPKSKEEDEKEYSYVMVFPREFDSGEFEFIESQRNIHENMLQNPQMYMGNYVMCLPVPVVPYPVYWPVEVPHPSTYNVCYAPNPYYFNNYNMYNVYC